MKSLATFIFMIAAAMIVSPSCVRADGGKPTAVTAIFAYYDALRAIGGPNAETVILLPPGSSPHDYEPTIKDKIATHRAMLIVLNGLNIDKWLGKMAADNGNATVVNIGDLVGEKGIKALHTEEVSVSDAKEKKAGDGEDDTAGNPHIWLDPAVQTMAAEAIRDAFIKLDSAHAAGYTERASAYLNELKSLDQEYRAAVGTFSQKEFIGFHSAYEYLANRYGLKQVASVEELPGEGPSISQTINIIHLIKNKHIKVIFTENAFPAKSADLIIRETGVTTGVLQPLETYDDAKQTYVGLMRDNLEAFKAAMK